jgi:5-methylcytosine-specific restriction endonuclease McrA
MTKSRSAGKKHQEKQPGLAIYHTMVIEENFERCAHRLHEMIKGAQRMAPGAPRILYLDVDGHRNEQDGFDRDAFEIIRHFVPDFLFPYLTEYHSPYRDAINFKGQRNDIPAELIISSPPDEALSYDVQILTPRGRDAHPIPRNSAPSVKAIAEYIGMSPARCLICKRVPVERAHAVPKSLGGSYDLRNFALLCPDHHRQAPDIADAEAFWAWIDYMVMRHSNNSTVSNFGTEHSSTLGIRLPNIEGSAERRAQFAESVERELVELYGWSEKEFASVTWKVNIELHKVLEAGTGYHFGISRKASTYAWAYDVALRRTGMERSRYIPIY